MPTGKRVVLGSIPGWVAVVIFSSLQSSLSFFFLFSKYKSCTHPECSLQKKYFRHDPDLLSFEGIPLGWAPRDISGFCMKTLVIGNLSFFRLEGGEGGSGIWSESDLAQ